MLPMSFVAGIFASTVLATLQFTRTVCQGESFILVGSINLIVPVLTLPQGYLQNLEQGLYSELRRCESNQMKIDNRLIVSNVNKIVHTFVIFLLLLHTFALHIAL